MSTRGLTAIAVLVLLAGCSGVTVEVDLGPSGGDSLGQVTTTNATVVTVVDGDTMDVRMPNGSTERIRLLGVDTPETHVEVQPGEWEGIPDTQAGRAWLSEWGENASSYARETLKGRRVQISTDRLADRRGDYGRLLVYVTPTGWNESFNRRLLEDGYARVYDGDFTRAATFASVESETRLADRGVWGFVWTV